MGQVEQRVKVRVNNIGSAGQLEQECFLAAIPLTAFEVGDATADRVGAAGCSAFGHLTIQGGELAIMQADRDLGRHSPSLASLHTNRYAF
jgi:hypothetical protein